MRITIVKMVGDCAFGWDGYNNWIAGITLDPYTAGKIREQLCYVRSVTIDWDE